MASLATGQNHAGPSAEAVSGRPGYSYGKNDAKSVGKGSRLPAHVSELEMTDLFQACIEGVSGGRTGELFPHTPAGGGRDSEVVFQGPPQR
jgi:hypothetical protein